MGLGGGVLGSARVILGVEDTTYKRQMKSAESDLDRFHGTAKRHFEGIGKMAAVAGGLIGVGGLALGLKESIDEARKAEVQQKKLETQMRASNLVWGDYSKQIKTALSNSSNLSGFTKIELTQSLTGLVRTTGNVNDALKLQAIAMDYARGKGVDLQTATMLVQKANLGMTGALKRAGIDVSALTTNVDKVKTAMVEWRKEHGKLTPAAQEFFHTQLDTAKALDKVATKHELVAKLQEKFAGQAKAYGQTSAGAADRFNAAMENLKVTIGERLLPIFTPLLNKAATWINKTVESKHFQQQLTSVVNGVVSAIKTMVTVVQRVVGMLGGWKHAIELLVALKFAMMVSGWVGSINKLVTAAKLAAGAMGLIGKAAVGSAEKVTASAATIEADNAAIAASARGAATAEGSISLGGAAVGAARVLGPLGATAALGLVLAPLTGGLDSALGGQNDRFKRLSEFKAAAGKNAKRVGQVKYKGKTLDLWVSDNGYFIVNGSTGQWAKVTKEEFDVAATGLSGQDLKDVIGSASVGSSAGSGGAGRGSRTAGGTSPPSSVAGSVVGYASRNLTDSRGGHGITPSQGFDCSGFVVAAYAAAGISLPHNAYQQWALAHGEPVPGGFTVHVGSPQPGDAVYWNNGRGGQQPGHVGIYNGGGMVWAYSEASGKPAADVHINYLPVMGIRRWVKIRSEVGTSGGPSSGGFDAGATAGAGGSAPKHHRKGSTTDPNSGVFTHVAHKIGIAIRTDVKAIGGDIGKQVRAAIKAEVAREKKIADAELAKLGKELSSIEVGASAAERQMQRLKSGQKMGKDPLLGIAILVPFTATVHDWLTVLKTLELKLKAAYERMKSFKLSLKKALRAKFPNAKLIAGIRRDIRELQRVINNLLSDIFDARATIKDMVDAGASVTQADAGELEKMAVIDATDLANGPQPVEFGAPVENGGSGDSGGGGSGAGGGSGGSGSAGGDNSGPGDIRAQNSTQNRQPQEGPTLPPGTTGDQFNGPGQQWSDQAHARARAMRLLHFPPSTAADFQARGDQQYDDAISSLDPATSNDLILALQRAKEDYDARVDIAKQVAKDRAARDQAQNDYRSAVYSLYRDFASNVGPPAAASGQNTHVTVNNHFQQPPADPFLWSKSLQWELAGMMG